MTNTLPAFINASWNGTPVLDGKATRVMAYDMARAWIAESFAGAEHIKYMDMFPSYGYYSEYLRINGTFSFIRSDDTGTAVFTVNHTVEA